MLRGYRGIILAFAGLALVGAGQPSEQSASGKQPEAHTNTSKANSPASIAGPSSQSQDHGCKKGGDDRHSDLCAQWKAADAAYDSAQWAWWQMLAGFFGLAVGGGTLFFAARAAHWAKKAAEHTETGALEAKRSADAAESAQRPWLALTIEPVSMARRGDMIYVQHLIVLKNIGTSIAYIESFHSNSRFSNLHSNGDDKALKSFMAKAHQSTEKRGQSLLPNEEIKHSYFADTKITNIPWRGEKPFRAATYLVMAAVIYRKSPDGELLETTRRFNLAQRKGGIMDRFLFEIDFKDGMSINGDEMIAHTITAPKTT